MGYELEYDGGGCEPLTCGNIERPDQMCENCNGYTECWGSTSQGG